MGRPKKGKVMKTKKTSSPVGEADVKPLDERLDDDKEQLRIVNLVCDAVDHEGGLSFFLLSLSSFKYWVRSSGIIHS